MVVRGGRVTHTCAHCHMAPAEERIKDRGAARTSHHMGLTPHFAIHQRHYKDAAAWGQKQQTRLNLTERTSRLHRLRPALEAWLRGGSWCRFSCETRHNPTQLTKNNLKGLPVLRAPSRQDISSTVRPALWNRLTEWPLSEDPDLRSRRQGSPEPDDGSTPRDQALGNHSILCHQPMHGLSRPG